MTRYLELSARLAARVADGELPPGSALPSVRDLAAAERTTASTVSRAYRRLAGAGVIVIEPRRSGRVATQGALAARALLRGEDPFRLAGSDDPALSMLVAGVPGAVESVDGSGSFRGLTALWSGEADGATLHLRHRSGEYNTPFARAVLTGREPVVVHLWRREQGLIVPAGNPRGVESVTDLAGLRVARRSTGTGTRTLLDRMLIDADLDPDAVSGPTVALHLDVALAIATGAADVGLGLRGAATALDLDFVPLVWEPFQLATTRAQSGGVQPLLDALGDRAVVERIRGLGGYDLDGAGAVQAIA